MKNMFSSPCGAGPGDVVDSSSRRVKLERRRGNSRSKNMAQLAGEYEYVPRQYGYDDAPPSYAIGYSSASSSAESSSIQHHLSNLLYQEESRSNVSSSRPTPRQSNQRRDATAMKARHVDFAIRKPKKSHWRPSEKEQRKEISKEQKQRRAERVGSPENQQLQQQYQHQSRSRGQRDDLRRTVERVLTAMEYQSVDSAAPQHHDRYSTGDSAQIHKHQSVPQQYQQQHHESQGWGDSQATYTRIYREQLEKQAEEKYIARANRNKKSYERRDDHGTQQHHREHQTDSRERVRGGSQKSNLSGVVAYEDVCPIMSYHPSEEGNQRRDSTPRDRKRSIEKTYQIYLQRERSKGQIPKQIMSKQTKPQITQSKKSAQVEKKKKEKEKKPGFFKRMMGGGKKKKTSKSRTKTPQQYPDKITLKQQLPASQQDGLRAIKKYGQPQSWMVYPASKDSSISTYDLSESTDHSYDRHQSYRQNSYQSQEDNYRSFTRPSSRGGHPKLPSSAVCVLPPLPVGHPRMAAARHQRNLWADRESGHHRIPIPASYMTQGTGPSPPEHYRTNGNRNIVPAQEPSGPPAHVPAAGFFSCR